MAPRHATRPKPVYEYVVPVVLFLQPVNPGDFHVGSHLWLLLLIYSSAEGENGPMTAGPRDAFPRDAILGIVMKSGRPAPVEGRPAPSAHRLRADNAVGARPATNQEDERKTGPDVIQFPPLQRRPSE